MSQNLEPSTANVEPVLRSPRLLLRPLRLDDALEFVRLLGEDEPAVSMMSHMPWPCDLRAAETWILIGFHAGARVFAILRADDQRFLGAIGFGGSALRPSFGYWIGRPFWRQGYATEALSRLLDYARSLGARGAEAETFPGNRASERVLEKCGFRRGALGRRHCPARGGMRDVLAWSCDF